MATRTPPAPGELIACLRESFALTTRAAALADAEGVVKRRFRTSYKKASEWLVNLAFGGDYIIVSAVGGSDIITHEMRPDPTGEFAFRWASLDAGADFPIIRIRPTGSVAADREDGMVGGIWLLLRANWERWVDNARAEHSRKILAKQERERAEHAALTAAHGESLGHLLGLLKAAGTTWNFTSTARNELRHHTDDEGRIVLELTLTGDTIDAVGALLREHGIEPVESHAVGPLIMPLADWEATKQQIADTVKTSRKEGAAIALPGQGEQW